MKQPNQNKRDFSQQEDNAARPGDSGIKRRWTSPQIEEKDYRETESAFSGGGADNGFYS